MARAWDWIGKWARGQVTRRPKTKAKQRTALPDVLITTPESLNILIAQKAVPKAAQPRWWWWTSGMSVGVEAGAGGAGGFLDSALRDAARERVPVWGVSATLAQPQEALEALVGHREGTLVRADITKEIHITSTMPQAFARLPWAAHWTPIAGRSGRSRGGASEHLDLHQHPSSSGGLVPGVARSQAGMGRPSGHASWIHLARAPDVVEDALHDGRVRAVVCTASLDWGWISDPWMRWSKSAAPRASRA